MTKKPLSNKDLEDIFRRMNEIDFSKPENQITEEEFKKFSEDTTEQDAGVVQVVPMSKRQA